jgi:phosphoribosylamine---glycine ligase
MNNILIVGAGGREHAFAWKIAQSPLCQNLYVAPGNAGTASLANNVNIDVNNFEALGALCTQKNINLVIVGPEEPLVRGIRDYFESTKALQHISIIGPNAQGAQLEGSKEFSKNFMLKYGIPTAASATFTKQSYAQGLQYLETQELPIVLKADGLAAGKGVIIAQSLPEAKKALEEMLMEAKFGQASEKVVIEEFLRGIELSVFVLTDGTNYKILPEAKDYKRIGEGDTGLNTGGMGAVSPVPFATAKFMDMVENRIVKPTLDGLRQEGISYKGFIFIGLMSCEGEPYVIEYNARMGDPETEVVLPRIESDVLAMFLAAANGQLHEYELELSPLTAVTTVVVAGGYPEAYQKGKLIEAISKIDGGQVFHAGTILNEQGQTLTNGGRVMAATGMSKTLEGAITKSQKAAKSINFEGKYFRKDIGLDILRSQ